MSPTDVATLEGLARKQGATPQTVLAEAGKMRRKKKLPPLSESAIRRVLRGEAYHRAKVERRGRPKKTTPKVIKAFEKTRKKLLKKAKSRYRVTYSGVMKEAGLTGKVSIRRIQPAVLKEEGVGWHPARQRLDRTAEEIAKRAAQAATWRQYPESHWKEDIHGYIDNKTFYVPISEKKKELLQKQKVTGHLRTKSEGSNPECLRPKKQKGGIGCPSVCITACVSPSKGRVIMWKENKTWNSDEAKAMYELHLQPALTRTYGPRDFYRVVEDGDPTGYQSSLGKAGKRAAKIRSWRLPPRTPEWMPLDYSIWEEIERKALEAAAKKETKASYGKKLKKVAKGLNVAYVKRVCAAMKKRIQGTFDAKGEHIQFD